HPLFMEVAPRSALPFRRQFDDGDGAGVGVRPADHQTPREPIRSRNAWGLLPLGSCFLGRDQQDQIAISARKSPRLPHGAASFVSSEIRRGAGATWGLPSEGMV